MIKEEFKVEGMSCMGCSRTVQSTLQELNGVETADINFEYKTVNVNYDETIVGKIQMQTAVADAGYQLK